MLLIIIFIRFDVDLINILYSHRVSRGCMTEMHRGELLLPILFCFVGTQGEKWKEQGVLFVPSSKNPTVKLSIY
jgi:hypothetical protein